jgi:tetratricopeptide (TPR) repeat protein
VVLVLASAATAHADASMILVFPFENLSNDRSLDWIGEGIAELMVEQLQFDPGVYVFTRDERLADYEKLGIPEVAVLSRATQLKLGWEIGADRVVAGKFSGTVEDFQISARIIDMEFSRASEEMVVRGKLQDVIALTGELLTKMFPGNSATITHPQSAFENYIRGMVSSDPMKQVPFLEAAIRLDPEYVPAILELGRVYHLERDFVKSNIWLERVTRLGIDRLRAQFLMGLNYFYLADYTRSIAIFQQLPPTYDVLLNLGAALSQKGDGAAAIAAWRRAVEADSLKSDAFFNIGYSSLLRGDLENAAKALNESLNVRGHDSEALFLLGRTYERQGRMEESQKLIGQASRLSQRVERWATQPLPKLERLSTSTTFTNGNEIWTDRRLARRAKGEGLMAWLESAQNQIDSYLYGEAIRELQNAIRVFPDASEAQTLLEEVQKQRTIR